MNRAPQRYDDHNRRNQTGNGIEFFPEKSEQTQRPHKSAPDQPERKQRRSHSPEDAVNNRGDQRKHKRNNAPLIRADISGNIVFLDGNSGNMNFPHRGGMRYGQRAKCIHDPAPVSPVSIELLNPDNQCERAKIRRGENARKGGVSRENATRIFFVDHLLHFTGRTERTLDCADIGNPANHLCKVFDFLKRLRPGGRIKPKRGDDKFITSEYPAEILQIPVGRILSRKHLLVGRVNAEAQQVPPKKERQHGKRGENPTGAPEDEQFDHARRSPGGN